MRNTHAFKWIMLILYRKRDRLKERRDREAEKIRMEQLAAKMSAKKLQRMKKVSSGF